VQILPMIEQNHVYSHFDFAEGAYSDSNSKVRAVRMDVLSCPSDYGSRSTVEGLGNVVSSSYAGSFGGDDVPIDSNNNGLLFLNSSINYRQIRDGATNTILVGEKINVTGLDDLSWASGTAAGVFEVNGCVDSQLVDVRQNLSDPADGVLVLCVNNRAG
jgi:hypothetical protein